MPTDTESNWNKSEGDLCPRCGETALRFKDGVCWGCWGRAQVQGSDDLERGAQVEELRRVLRERRRKRG